MNVTSRRMLLGALTLIFLSSACGVLTPEEIVIPVGTILVEDQTRLPQPTTTVASLATATDLSITPIIPITGENVVSMQCQFCVEDETHAVLVFPDFTYFDVVSTTPVGCFTADVVNGQRILICRGAQQTSFLLNICSDPTNCLQFPVALQACPLLPTGAEQATSISSGPVFLVPINTLKPPERDEDPPLPASTPVPPLPSTRTSVPATPTSQPPITTTAPPPTTRPTDPPPTIRPTEPEPPPQPTNTNPPPPTVAPTQGNGGGGGGGEEGGSVVICHISPGNPNNRKTMTVSQSAWENEHSRHGDSRGPC